MPCLSRMKHNNLPYRPFSMTHKAMREISDGDLNLYLSETIRHKYLRKYSFGTSARTSTGVRAAASLVVWTRPRLGRVCLLQNASCCCGFSWPFASVPKGYLPCSWKMVGLSRPAHPSPSRRKDSEGSRIASDETKQTEDDRRSVRLSS